MMMMMMYVCMYYKIRHLYTHAHLPCRLGLKNAPTAPLQRGKTPTNECPGYDTRQSDGEVLVMLGLWVIWSTLHCHCSQCHSSKECFSYDRALSMGSIELNCIHILNWIGWIRNVWINWIAWKRNVFGN